MQTPCSAWPGKMATNVLQHPCCQGWRPRLLGTMMKLKYGSCFWIPNEFAYLYTDEQGAVAAALLAPYGLAKVYE